MSTIKKTAEGQKNTTLKTSPKKDIKNNPSIQKTKTENTKNKTVTSSGPAYVVAVTKRDPTEAEKQNSTYSPSEIKSKAREFLSSGSMPAEQREVLEKILAQEEKNTLSKKPV